MIMQAMKTLQHASELEKNARARPCLDKRFTVELVCRWANLQVTGKLLNRKKGVGVPSMVKTKLSPLVS